MQNHHNALESSGSRQQHINNDHKPCVAIDMIRIVVVRLGGAMQYRPRALGARALADKPANEDGS